MKEYEMLRQEILDSLNAIVQYNTLLYTVTVAILAFAFEKESPFLCLIPYVAIIPIYSMTEEYRRVYSLLAAYMIVFLEGDEHHWETRSFEFKQRYRNIAKGPKSIIWYMLNLGSSSQIPYLFLACACSICAVYKVIIRNVTNAEKGASILVVFCITVLTMIMMIQNSKKYVHLKENYIKEWQELKAAEEEAQKRKNDRNPQ